MKKLSKLNVPEVNFTGAEESKLNAEETRKILGGFADSDDIYADCAGGISGGCKPGCKPGCQSSGK